MIVKGFLDLVLAAVSGLLSLLPTWNLDDSAVTSFSGTLGDWMGRANGYVPEHLLWSCVGLLAAVRLALWAWRGLVFVYSMIPFVG